MNNGLKQLLDEKKAFKLICAAGNKDLASVENLVAIYSKAGCHFFDLAADAEVLKAAQRGLDFSISKEEQKDYHFCVSVGTDSDKHFQKARIDSDKCKRCEQCVKACPQKAISQYIKVVKDKCIGCERCLKVCKHGAIEMNSESSCHFLSFLGQSPVSISCVELHVSDALQAKSFWKSLNENYSGLLSVCLGRSKFSNEQAIELVKDLLSVRKPYATIIQADGSPMSGGDDDYETTLQAVAMAELIEKTNLPVYIIASGGTNSKTRELATLCNVDLSGVAVGSYARMIVRDFVEKDNLLSCPESFDNAVKIASKLVQICS